MATTVAPEDVEQLWIEFKQDQTTKTCATAWSRSTCRW